MSALHSAVQRSSKKSASANSAPSINYHAFLVEPTGDFHPGNWQDKPSSYRIVEYLGQKKYRGDADAWRFLHNREAIRNASTQRWAIYVS